MPVHRHPVAATSNPQHLGSIPMDRGLIERLSASFERIRPQGQRLGEAFYARLFQAAPHLRSMFTSDSRVQSAKLVTALDLIVRNLADPEKNAVMIAELGRRHTGYGARPEHYPLVVDLLVASIAEVLGQPTSAPILGEWRTALELISRQMIAASEQAGVPVPTSAQSALTQGGGSRATPTR